MIPYGYKQTEVGVIPEDWKCVPLLSKCSLLNGLTYNPENVSRYGLLVIRSSNIQCSHLVFSDNVYVDLSVDSEKLIKKDDIIVCVRNGSASLIGKCAKAENDYFATFGSFMAVLRGNCNDFIFQLLQQGTIQKHISKNSGATINQITNGDLKTIFIPFPSDKKEQHRIAEALSDVDGMISSLEKLIAKYKSIKTACLQQMFPQNGETVPRMRLPGFTGAWEQRKLSELASIHARIGWQNLRTSEFLDSGDYMLITGTDFNDGAINFSTCHYVERERYEQDRNIQIHNGSILITKDGTLGKVAYVQGLSMPATLNAGVFNVQIKDANIVDEKYLFQYLKAPYLMDYVSKKATGGTIKHLNQNILVDFPVVMPKKSEQILIGAYFQQLDSLITFHQRKLEKVQKIKQGMMQQLLTGKIRLV